MKTKGRKKYNDSWMYIFLLSTIVILADSLKTYTFNIKDIAITYSIFLLPTIYFVSSYITKKYGYKKGLSSIIISSLSLIAFLLLMNFAIGRDMSFSSISGQLCGYIISQVVNITIYKFLLNNTTSPYILVFLNYVFSLIVYYMIYTLIHLDMIILDSFWTSYFIVLGIQSIIYIGLTIVDKNIKIGIGKDD